MAILIWQDKDGLGGYNNPVAFLSLVKSGYVLNEGRYSNSNFDETLRLASVSKSDSERSIDIA